MVSYAFFDCHADGLILCLCFQEVPQFLNLARVYEEFLLGERFFCSFWHRESFLQRVCLHSMGLGVNLRSARGVDLYEIFQFAHAGDTPRRLRKKLESLVSAAKDEDLARLTRVLEALVD